MAENWRIAGLRDLKAGFESLSIGDDDGRDRLVKKGRVLITRVFGDDTPHVDEFSDIRFYSLAFDDQAADRRAFAAGKSQAINLIDALMYELDLETLAREESEVAGLKSTVQSQERWLSKIVTVLGAVIGLIAGIIGAAGPVADWLSGAAHDLPLYQVLGAPQAWLFGYSFGQLLVTVILSIIGSLAAAWIWARQQNG